MADSIYNFIYVEGVNLEIDHMNRPYVPHLGGPPPSSGGPYAGVCEINRQPSSDWNLFAGSSRVCGAPWPRRSWSNPVSAILTMIQCHRSQNATRGMYCNLLRRLLTHLQRSPLSAARRGIPFKRSVTCYSRLS